MDQPQRRGQPVAWFSAAQLFFVALLFLTAFAVREPAHAPYSALLLTLALGFVFLSADEAATIHEDLSLASHSLPWNPHLNGHGIWIALYLLAGGAVLALGWRRLGYLRDDFPHIVRLLALGVGLYLLGGVLVEALSYTVATRADARELVVLQASFEELFEMAGVTVVLYGAATLLIEMLAVPERDIRLALTR